VPLRRSGSPFKGIQENQGEAFFVVFYRKNWNLLLRRSTLNRSTFKEVRVGGLTGRMAAIPWEGCRDLTMPHDTKLLHVNWRAKRP
jgi:hypothetical protein